MIFGNDKYIAFQTEPRACDKCALLNHCPESLEDVCVLDNVPFHHKDVIITCTNANGDKLTANMEDMRNMLKDNQPTHTFQEAVQMLVDGEYDEIKSIDSKEIFELGCDNFLISNNSDSDASNFITTEEILDRWTGSKDARLREFVADLSENEKDSLREMLDE